MFKSLPPLLRKACLGLILAMVGFFSVLIVSTPIPYIVTMGIGCVGAGISTGCFLLFLIKELKTTNP